MLKANCPVLVEHMVHSSISLVGGEAFNLLLKRPWNPAVGMHSMDKQVHNICIELVGFGGAWSLWNCHLINVHRKSVIN